MIKAESDGANPMNHVNHVRIKRNECQSNILHGSKCMFKL